MCLCVYVYVCVCVCMCVNVSVYLYIIVYIYVYLLFHIYNGRDARTRGCVRPSLGLRRDLRRDENIRKKRPTISSALLHTWLRSIRT